MADDVFMYFMYLQGWSTSFFLGGVSKMFWDMPLWEWLNKFLKNLYNYINTIICVCYTMWETIFLLCRVTQTPSRVMTCYKPWPCFSHCRNATIFQVRIKRHKFWPDIFSKFTIGFLAIKVSRMFWFFFENPMETPGLGTAALPFLLGHPFLGDGRLPSDFVGGSRRSLGESKANVATFGILYKCWLMLTPKKKKKTVGVKQRSTVLLKLCLANHVVFPKLQGLASWLQQLLCRRGNAEPQAFTDAGEASKALQEAGTKAAGLEGDVSTRCKDPRRN